MLATIIVAILLVALVTWIVINAVKNKKEGKSSCGCNCSCCPMSSSCHSETIKK